MDSWSILNIKETRDKENIRKAYRTKLAVTNPEDDPEGFMKLREALEEALRFADSQDGSAADSDSCDRQDTDDSPVGRWIGQADELYRCFSKRIDPNQWEQLLQDDFCQNLDTKLLARDALLEYLTEHFFVPQCIMQTLDRYFDFRQNMKELEELFPQEFLDLLLVQRVQKKEYPPYESLEGDDSLPFDQYLYLSSRLGRCLEGGDTKGAYGFLKKMADTGIKSPYFGIDKAKALCQEDKFAEAQAVVEEVISQYGAMEDARLMRADIAFFVEDIQRARNEYEAVLDRNPDSLWAKFGLGKCLVKEGKFKESNEIFSVLLEENPYDPNTSQWLKQCSRLYMEVLEQRVERHSDQDILFELAWCYYQSEEYEKVCCLLDSFEPKPEKQLEYNSLAGRARVYSGREEEALEYLERWEQQLLQLPDIDENQKKYQLPYILLLKSKAYSIKGEKKAALKMVEQSLLQDPDNGEFLSHKGQLLCDIWDFNGAVEAFTKAIAANPNVHIRYLMRAKAFYMMEYYGEAFSDCQRALTLYPYELTAYAYKIRILIEAEELEVAEETIQFLEQEGIGGSELLFLKGYLEEGRQHVEQAKALYRRIIEEYETCRTEEENCFDLENLAEVYRRLALLEYDEKMEDFEPVIQWINKGLEEDERDVLLIEMKAEIAYSCDHYEEAAALYQQISELAPAKIGTYGMLDNVYRETEQWEKALECAKLQVEQTPSGYAYMRRGQLLTCLECMDEAWEDFLTASKLDPEQAYIYNYMGVILEFQDQEEEALAHYLKAIVMGEENGEPCEEAYGNASNLYCRKKDFEQAAEMFQWAYKETENPLYLYRLIEPRRLGGQFAQAEEALECYRKEEGLKTNAVIYKWELGHIYRDSLRLDKALACYESIGDREPAALREAAKILFHQGKGKKALQYLTKAIDMLEEDYEIQEEGFLQAEYYLWAAKASIMLGRKEEALLLVDEAAFKIPNDVKKQTSPCLPMVYQMLGGMAAIQGEGEQALSYLKEALSIRKCDYCNYERCVDALFELGYFYELQGDKQAALEYYKQGLEAAPVDSDLYCRVQILEKGIL